VEVGGDRTVAGGVYDVLLRGVPVLGRAGVAVVLREAMKMNNTCLKCGYALDPWGDCIRCVPIDVSKQCESLKTSVMRDLQTMHPAQIVARYQNDTLSADVINAIGKQMKRGRRPKK
jgi:hypothetical protein